MSTDPDDIGDDLTDDDRPHDLDSPTCWCNPEILQICPECEEQPSEAVDDDGDNSPCWRCGGRGLVEVYDEELSKIIIHRYHKAE